MKNDKNRREKFLKIMYDYHRGDGMATTDFQRALDFIEEHIMENITLHDIAKESGYSVPQCYRLFK